MHHQPDGAAFDIVLLLHVACVVVGLVTTATAAATATRLRRLLGSSLPLPETLRRYFRPGVNWAGRTVYGIPVFGFALLAMSQGAYALGQGWVLGGLAIFAAVALAGRGRAVAGRAAAAGRPARQTAMPRRTCRRRSCWTATPPSCPRAAVAALVLLRGRDRADGRAALTQNCRTGPPGEGPVLSVHPMLRPAQWSQAGRLSRSPCPPPTGGGSV